MKTKRAGALLFAIITAFVLTLIVSTLVIFTTNQYRIIDSEIDRIRAFYRAQAGMEYAIFNLYNGTAGWTVDTTHPLTVNGIPINININNDPDGISTYRINISTNY